MKWIVAGLVAMTLAATTASAQENGPSWEGREAFMRRDFAMAIDKWLPLANTGNSMVQYNMGVVHANGNLDRLLEPTRFCIGSGERVQNHPFGCPRVQCLERPDNSLATVPKFIIGRGRQFPIGLLQDESALAGCRERLEKYRGG